MCFETSFVYERTSTGYETAVSTIIALGWFLDRLLEPPIPTCERKRLLFNQCFPPATYKAIYNSALYNYCSTYAYWSFAIE
jgi:hypothetical protein